MELALSVLAIPFIYFFFCIMALDHQGRAHVYVRSGPNTLYGPLTRQDAHFRWFGLGAVVPTGLIVTTALFNKAYCSFHPESLRSIQTLFAVLTVYLIGKVFLGPSGEVRKSVLLLDEKGNVARPLSFIISDALLVIPGNLLRGWFWKIPTLLILAICYVFNFRINDSTYYYFSFPAIVVWMLMCQGRLASIIVSRQVGPGIGTLMYISLAVACALVWDLSEKSLADCGVAAGTLPSFSTIVLSDESLTILKDLLQRLISR